MDGEAKADFDSYLETDPRVDVEKERRKAIARKHGGLR